MSRLSPTGTIRERFLAAGGSAPGGPALWGRGEEESDFEPWYFGWEIARCAPSLGADEQRALAVLAAACMMAVRAGSTRLPLDGRLLRPTLAALGAADAAEAVASIVARARAAAAGDPVAAVVGHPGERKPLIVDGQWLYPERMHVLEERFCVRVRERLGALASAQDTRSIQRALNAVAPGPPALTDEQKRAVREALGARLALVTGAPGTGKTTIVVALLRALAWRGTSMDAVAIAAPTGKAAQRLRYAIAEGLSSTANDIAQAALRTIAPLPQTLHRLLGWSPSSGRFARHENDPLPHRVVIVDEASMVDLAMMDRLVRALSADARLVLLGDADQLPSVEAGAVFRDLCAGLGAARLTVNLRVADDPTARRIVTAAGAVNRGALDEHFLEAVTTRRTVGDLTFEGVEHLAAPFGEVGDELLERWWRVRVASLDGFSRAIARSYRMRAGAFDDLARSELGALFEHFGRSRLLCATRSHAAASAEAVNLRLLARLGGKTPLVRRRSARSEFAAGAPVVVERNDYERQLYNGDQGVVAWVDAGTGGGSELMAVFPQGETFSALPLGAVAPLAPAFAMTVHKAQGSEFDHVALVLPEVDLPLVTRELVYTAMTRARRSVLLVGTHDLLARAVSRTVGRHSGVAEKLAQRTR